MVRYRQKRNNQDIKKVELYAHCSLLRIHKLVFFLLALIKIYFIVKLYTHVEYIHASEYIFLEFYETRCPNALQLARFFDFSKLFIKLNVITHGCN